jgi:hypothetical protein
MLGLRQLENAIDGLELFEQLGPRIPGGRVNYQVGIVEVQVESHIDDIWGVVQPGAPYLLRWIRESREIGSHCLRGASIGLEVKASAVRNPAHLWLKVPRLPGPTPTLHFCIVEGIDCGDIVLN